ncbi:hypothetical protein DPMN_183236 [Dreissena polymorpha]|uniref:Uncharacterized protein n=1 Tax=Dreissena polymorpha TaxID=45954 RepID=A0A9D4I3F5_DREPO|nr:hypothetical protein DPMN_183236 [Dreissena polymorpha]
MAQNRTGRRKTTTGEAWSGVITPKKGVGLGLGLVVCESKERQLCVEIGKWFRTDGLTTLKQYPSACGGDKKFTNILTKFHEDRKINVASRELTRKNAAPPGGHVFQPTGIIFKLVQDIIGTNLLTKFHEDWTINVSSRAKNAPPLGSHVFQANVTIFELIQDIIETNLLTKFHEDWTINVAARVLTRQMLTPLNARRTKGDHKSSP